MGKTGWAAQRHTTSHDAGMIDTADLLGLHLHRCMHETALIIQFASTELAGVSFQIDLFISKCKKRISKIFYLIYRFTELYQKKYLNKVLNMHEWMNENIWTTIRVSWQRPVARLVKSESARCEVKGSSPHVRQRLFEVSKSVIYDIIRLQLFRTYNANIICYLINVTWTKNSETKIPIKLQCQDGDSNPHLTMLWYMLAPW